MLFFQQMANKIPVGFHLEESRQRQLKNDRPTEKRAKAKQQVNVVMTSSDTASSNVPSNSVVLVEGTSNRKSKGKQGNCATMRLHSKFVNDRKEQQPFMAPMDITFKVEHSSSLTYSISPFK